MPVGPPFTPPPEMYVNEQEPHLGGYIQGGDPLSWTPELWEWILTIYPIRSVLDIGCGEGHALRWFRDHGCDVRGVDGIPQPDPDIVQHDFTKGAYWPARDFDLGWCCEFVEHVPELLVGNFLITLLHCRLLLMTHAVPDQGGHHHVNCQHADYWIDQMTMLGFDFDEELTLEARQRCPHSYFLFSGLAFRRRD